VGYRERYLRAKAVLEEVGLGSKLKNKPNQLSGGQMQRVAIARALINDPDILLADEPTGALDSKTSVQIMDLIKKISANRLVIMVTHNEQIAAEYSDRVLEMLDGKIINDSHPLEGESENVEERVERLQKSTRMGFIEALKSSFKNLISKKGRTIAVSIAGSIGIIAIGLVLSLSAGIKTMVSDLQSDALAGFPLTISRYVATTDALLNQKEQQKYPTDNEFHYYDSGKEYINHENHLTQEYLDYLEKMDESYYNSITYSRGVSINMLYKTSGNVYGKVEGDSAYMGLINNSLLGELPNSKDFILSQYDLLSDKSRYPENYNELVLVVDNKNNIDADVLRAFGFDVKENYTIEDLIGKTFKVVGNDDYYSYDSEGNVYVENRDYKAMYEKDSPNTFEVTIVGIMRLKENSASDFLSTGILYSYLLTDKLIENANGSAVVTAQRANKEINVLSGKPFNEQITYDAVMRKLGGDANPTAVAIYPKTFETKEKIKAYLDKYNEGKKEDDKVIYSDLAEMLTSTITSIINIITIVLTVIAAISLVVSSIMISIIIYVSVIERTKEIGIMRSIGARKRDVARIFSAEAISIGLIAGLFGVVMTYILGVPISLIVSKLMGETFKAVLPIGYAAILVLVSVALTFVAGVMPSRKASRKDPVTALRTE
jgi:putative ABC transport system permease protein